MVKHLEKIIKHHLACIEKRINYVHMTKIIPNKVPKKNGESGTPTIGDATLINQLGIRGVALRNAI